MKVLKFILMLSLFTSPVFAASHHAKLTNHTLTPQMSDEGHFQSGLAALKDQNWKEAIQHFRTIFYAYPDSERVNEAHFYTGIGYYHISEFDIANDAFTNYLQGDPNPAFFQEALDYKFAIAENFRLGERCRAFGLQPLPKLFSGKDRAVEIYDEIIATVPSHDMAVKSLYSKAQTLWDMRDFQGGVEAYRLLIRRYPRHELAPESYASMMKLYVDQVTREPENHDILPFAQMNLIKFEQDFPRDERIAEGKNAIVSIKEVYAQGLFETAKFYERIAQPKAAFIYYKNALKEYPETQVAQACRDRLDLIATKKEA